MLTRISLATLIALAGLGGLSPALANRPEVSPEDARRLRRYKKPEQVSFVRIRDVSADVPIVIFTGLDDEQFLLHGATPALAGEISCMLAGAGATQNRRSSKPSDNSTFP